MQAASATLEPPNLWTFQASTLHAHLGQPPTGPGRRVAATRRAECGSGGGDSFGAAIRRQVERLYLLAARQAN